MILQAKLALAPSWSSARDSSSGWRDARNDRYCPSPQHPPQQLQRVESRCLCNLDEFEHIDLALPGLYSPDEIVRSVELLREFSLTEPGSVSLARRSATGSRISPARNSPPEEASGPLPAGLLLSADALIRSRKSSAAPR
jgi:hypothetical protein